MGLEIIRLYDEKALMSELSTDTLHLIHATSVVAAIKRLVTAYDIILLNLEIEKKFSMPEPPWDVCALQDLNTIRRELVIYHRVDFDPAVLVDKYNSKMGTLIRLAGLRLSPSLIDSA